MRDIPAIEKDKDGASAGDLEHSEFEHLVKVVPRVEPAPGDK